MSIVHVSLRVSGASAKNGYCVYGAPSPFAAIGFAHALCARARVHQRSGVLFTLYDYQDRAVAAAHGRLGYALQRSAQRDTADGGKKPGTQLDIPRCDLEVGMTFAADPRVDEPLRGSLEAALDTMRFAGGRIDDCHVAIDYDSLQQGLRRPGFALVEPDVACAPGVSAFAALVDLASPLAGRSGWYVPSLVGFRLLEKPRARDGVRGNFPHAFCDPLFWALEWRSCSRIENAEQHLWRLVRTNEIIKFTTKGAT